VPAAEGEGADVGASASADLSGVVVGELGRSAEVGVRSEVGVSALVRVVASVPSSSRSAIQSRPGRVGSRSVRSWGGCGITPAAGPATGEPQDQAQHEPGQQPCHGRFQASAVAFVLGLLISLVWSFLQPYGF
jgi:hypothetical protein